MLTVKEVKLGEEELSTLQVAVDSTTVEDLEIEDLTLEVANSYVVQAIMDIREEATKGGYKTVSIAKQALELKTNLVNLRDKFFNLIGADSSELAELIEELKK